MGIRRWAERLSLREPSLLIRLFDGTAAPRVRIVTTGEQNLPIFNEIKGWRGAVPGATPYLPVNVVQRPSNTLFASVCSFGVHFVPEAASPSQTSVVPQSAENLMKQGVAQKVAGFAPPSASPPPLRLCALWSLQDAPAFGAETGRPRCRISDRCQTRRINPARCWWAG